MELSRNEAGNKQASQQTIIPADHHTGRTSRQRPGASKFFWNCFIVCMATTSPCQCRPCRRFGRLGLFKGETTTGYQYDGFSNHNNPVEWLWNGLLCGTVLWNGLLCGTVLWNGFVERFTLWNGLPSC